MHAIDKFIRERCDEIQALFIAEHINVFARQDQAISRIGVEIESISVLLQAGPDNTKAIIPDSLSSFAIAYLIPPSANNWQPGRIIKLCGFPPVA